MVKNIPAKHQHVISIGVQNKASLCLCSMSKSSFMAADSYSYVIEAAEVAGGLQWRLFRQLLFPRSRINRQAQHSPIFILFLYMSMSFVEM